MNTFKVGDLCWLNSEDSSMTVMEILDDNSITACWFTNDLELRFANFPIACLSQQEKED